MKTKLVGLLDTIEKIDEQIKFEFPLTLISRG